MLSQKDLEMCLTRAMDSAADFAEIYEENEHAERISMLDGRVEKVDRSIVAGTGIRLYKGVQSVYGYSNESSAEALFPLIDDLRTALGPAEEAPKTVALARVAYENRHPVKVRFEEVSLEEKAALLRRAESAARAVDPRIVKVASFLLNVRQNVQISNSSGKLIGDTRVRTRLFAQVYARDGSNFQDGYEAPGAGMGLEYYEKMTPEEIGREAARIALVLLDAKPCPSGRMPAVIDNGFGGAIFHEACGHALEATGVAKNQSVFAGKFGQKIAADCVNAVDDGTIPNAWGSENIDDEGNFQQRRQLITNGVLTSYMIDQLDARRMGMAPTGSSRRESYQFEPTSRMSNTYICAGTDSFEDLLAGIRKGLYARKMRGGSVNPATGEFNFSVMEGYMIENGKIAYPVKGAALIGSGAEILMNIDKVSANLELAPGMCGSLSGMVPVNVGQPAIRVASITVGGTANE